METTKLIQVLVYVLAAVIILIFIISGIHFVRSVHLSQAEDDRERNARRFANRLAASLGGRPRQIELKEQDGVIIIQPDGAQEIAVTGEIRDEPGRPQAAGLQSLPAASRPLHPCLEPARVTRDARRAPEAAESSQQGGLPDAYALAPSTSQNIASDGDVEAQRGQRSRQHRPLYNAVYTVFHIGSDMPRL